jgi:hypothetical protein
MIDESEDDMKGNKKVETTEHFDALNGNERAERLAMTAVFIFPRGRAVVQSDEVHVFCEVGKVDNSPEDSYSCTMATLKNGLVKLGTSLPCLGTAIHGPYSGSRRRVAKLR